MARKFLGTILRFDESNTDEMKVYKFLVAMGRHRKPTLLAILHSLNSTVYASLLEKYASPWTPDKLSDHILFINWRRQNALDMQYLKMFSVLGDNAGAFVTEVVTTYFSQFLTVDWDDDWNALIEES